MLAYMSLTSLMRSLSCWLSPQISCSELLSSSYCPSVALSVSTSRFMAPVVSSSLLTSAASDSRVDLSCSISVSYLWFSSLNSSICSSTVPHLYTPSAAITENTTVASTTIMNVTHPDEPSTPTIDRIVQMTANRLNARNSGEISFVNLVSFTISSSITTSSSSDGSWLFCSGYEPLPVA